MTHPLRRLSPQPAAAQRPVSRVNLFQRLRRALAGFRVGWRGGLIGRDTLDVPEGGVWYGPDGKVLTDDFVPVVPSRPVSADFIEYGPEDWAPIKLVDASGRVLKVLKQ
jgi:hypothetical protein